MDRSIQEPFLCIAAVAVGLVIGAALAPITFRNQFQQIDMARNMSILSLSGGGLYLLIRRQRVL
jgi:xanthine/uracil permease